MAGRACSIPCQSSWPSRCTGSLTAPTKHTPLYRHRAERVGAGYRLLADCGFGLSKWVLHRYLEPKTGRQRFGDVETVFDKSASRLQSVVEHSNAQFKGHFRMFMDRATAVEDLESFVFSLCVILHNLCTTAGDVVLPEDKVHEDAAPPESDSDSDLVSSSDAEVEAGGAEDASKKAWQPAQRVVQARPRPTRHRKCAKRRARLSSYATTSHVPCSRLLHKLDDDGQLVPRTTDDTGDS
jgi:hypothetical protein